MTPSCRVAHQNPTPLCPQQQQPLGPSPWTSCQYPKVECASSVKQANLPAMKSKRHGWTTPNSSGATLSLIGDGSASFKSLTPTPFHMPQFTSMLGKATTEARAHSLSRDSDSLAGPHDQTEVFPTDFGPSLPPTTPIPSISGSQLVGGSVYAPPFPPTMYGACIQHTP